jgi:hypothetical protein
MPLDSNDDAGPQENRRSTRVIQPPLSGLGHRLLPGAHRSTWYLEIPCKPHHAHCANTIPIQIELVPSKTVTGRLRFGVVIIMSLPAKNVSLS